jgi:hypothetical protein
MLIGFYLFCLQFSCSFFTSYWMFLCNWDSEGILTIRANVHDTSFQLYLLHIFHIYVDCPFPLFLEKTKTLFWPNCPCLLESGSEINPPPTSDFPLHHIFWPPLAFFLLFSLGKRGNERKSVPRWFMILKEMWFGGTRCANCYWPPL